MSFDQWLIFLPAAFALNIFPGPNNLLSLSNGARFGLSAAFWAGFGRLPAFAVMVALTALGLGALLATSETAFLVLKWAGALYLLYLGIGMIRAPVPDPEQQAQASSELSLKTLLRQEFFVAASNPKAMAIFTAFLPQFIQPGEAVWSQLALMGAAFIVMEIAAMAIYAAGGWRLRGLARSRTGLKWINRSSGAALIAAAFALLLSRRAAAPG
jgi:threonine/homoserine/homoserine lactone efflux protein